MSRIPDTSFASLSRFDRSTSFVGSCAAGIDCFTGSIVSNSLKRVWAYSSSRFSARGLAVALSCARRAIALVVTPPVVSRGIVLNT